MSVDISGPPSSATRNKAITAELRKVLEIAAQAAGIDRIVITSGGQDALGEGTRRTGSTRHDRGRAADVYCIADGVTLTFTDQDAHPRIVAFVTEAAAAGANGIGAGVHYMGNKVIHVGFGTSPSDGKRLAWGAGGAVAAAPGWLTAACQAGWSRATAAAQGVAPSAGPSDRRFIVIARDGLRLRAGPGTSFNALATLPLQSMVTILDPATQDAEWVKVDLQDDGLADGFVFKAFLAPIGTSEEQSPEPG